MAKADNPLVQGECSICGLPGLVGMSCDDPLCSGTVQPTGEARPKSVDSERYQENLLKENDPIISLDELSKAEETAEDEII